MNINFFICCLCLIWLYAFSVCMCSIECYEMIKHIHINGALIASTNRCESFYYKGPLQPDSDADSLSA